MIDRKELEKFGPPGFHLGQKEKDYAQHWVLSYLSRSGFNGIFKGGTCLQKAFGLPRYSEDLDFTLKEEKEPDYDALSAFLSSSGFTVVSLKREENQNSINVRLRYRGPLYAGTAISEGTLTLELSRREMPLLKPKAILIRPPYPDLLPYQLLVMDNDEIVAEKMRALFTRVSGRDLFDLYFLFKLGACVKKELVNEKLKFYKMNFDKKIFRKKLRGIKRVWKTEISALTKAPIDYEEAARSVLKQVDLLE